MTGAEAGGGGVADLVDGRDDDTGISSGSAVRTSAISAFEACGSSTIAVEDV